MEPLSRCLLTFDHALHRAISFIGNKSFSLCLYDSKMRFKDIKKVISSKLKCLHESNTNGRNYIIIIIIVIIHLGPVQYNNKQNPFEDIAFGDTM